MVFTCMYVFPVIEISSQHEYDDEDTTYIFYPNYEAKRKTFRSASVYDQIMRIFRHSPLYHGISVRFTSVIQIETKYIT